MYKSLNFAIIIIMAIASTSYTKESSYKPEPGGNGQLSTKPEWFEGGKNTEGSTYFYYGQKSQNSKIILTASNGFFDKGVRAKGLSGPKDLANGWSESATAKKNGKKGHPPLIGHDYEYLENWDSTSESIRWHLWCPSSGKVFLKFKMSAKDDKTPIVINFGGIIKKISTSELDLPVEFDIQKTGKVSIVLKTATEGSPGKLHSISLYGPLITEAKLLRGRWRPVSIHGSYRSSKLNDTKMWVMASKSISNSSSYSPITTPFGYFGNSFAADKKASGGCNFSMWSNTSKPMEQQSHLLAVGSPKAQFEGFGHEGTGVKPRGWEPFDFRPEEVILSLRVERDGKYNTYYGYFYNNVKGRWQLYAAGRKWAAKREKALWPGSFVEIPGPPTVQRSGDEERTVLRKGWCLDNDKKWVRLDSLPTGKGKLQHKYWGVDDKGWFVFKVGGLEHYTFDKGKVELPQKFISEKLPDYLSPEKIKQLYELPAEYGSVSVKAESTKVILSIDLKKAGSNPTMEIHYGLNDFLTYAKRKRNGTEKKSSVLDNNRFWPQSLKQIKVTNGVNEIPLSNLKPNTKYFFRVLVSNDSGKMWSFETYSFTTAK